MIHRIIKNKGFMIFLLATAVLFPLHGCKDNVALFDEMSSNRLTILIKGTYASNAPTEPWVWGSLDSEDIKDSDSVVLCDEPAGDEVEMPTQYMIDIAEMKLNKDSFSNYRTTKKFNLTDDDPFFDGTGVELNNDDPVHLKDYTYLRLYTRKMVFDQARIYEQGPAGWTYKELAEVLFNEKDTKGFNINQLQKNTYYDSLRVESSYINRIYPIRVPIIGGLTYNRNNDETVIEVRLMVKNYIKKFEYTDYEDDELQVVHYFGFSDWLRDVHQSENDIGGNIAAVARAYVPEIVGSIAGSNAAGRNIFVIAIPSGDPITRYSLVSPAGFSSSAPGDITEQGDGLYQITTASDHSQYVFEGDYIEITSWGSTHTDKYMISEVAADHIDFTAARGHGDASGVDFNLYPASDRGNNPCDLPQEPQDPSSYINTYLDYYLSYEEYKKEWNDAIELCNANTLDDNTYADLDADDDYTRIWDAYDDYGEAWVSYDNSLKDFILPPLAAYSEAGGTYTLENIMPGNYDVYITNGSAGNVSDVNRYGQLFYHDEFDLVGTIAVGENEAVTFDVP
ncbi:MAG TPA: hypothetical protein PK926_01515 [Spirochaetota bacterium]|nr:hypothetical protein [Spirochaetota bacterium]HPI88064.1 hypothetical protein [Spirochaetota bacterium]HPR46451.1 hypothetical protein [Spirochaetota bacterium]